MNINARRLSIVVGGLLAAMGVAWLVAARGHADGSTRYAMHGMVMKVADSRQSFVVSHDSVPGVMDAMTMSFDVDVPGELEPIEPGAMVDFTLVMGKDSVYARDVRSRPYETIEQDPVTARRLKMLSDLTRSSPSTVKALRVGERVPNFTLIDQSRNSVSLSQLRGRVVAVNFIYTSCVLPQFCFRTANNFGVIEKRFKARAAKDLILLTVTFDPERDTPERLAEYASQWHPDPDAWHFLTGPTGDIKRLCDLFAVDFFPEEGLMNHSSHTAVIDRAGRLFANVEGNHFTAAQIGDLVATALNN
jgi:protein SCO1/2